MKILELEVLEVRREAKDTVTILLQRKDGSSLDYRAGQFLTFLFSLHGHALRRSYSFSSTPGIDPIPAITVKRVVNGEVSRYLLDHLQTGDQLLSLLPAGKFILGNEDQPYLFFIAAGSGIAPVFGLVKEALLLRPGTRVVLLSQQHDEESIIFKTSLEKLEQQYKGRFQWISLLSAPLATDGRNRTGRLNNRLLEDLLEEWLPGGNRCADMPPMFYLCGPPAFMRMALFTLRLMGVPDERIRKENFTVEYVPPPPLLADTRPRKVIIHASDISYQFEVAWPSTILQAALDHHIPLPYSCKGGRCSSCVARCLQGSVKMSINEVLTEKDLAAGLVLTCVGYAETDIELRY